MVSNSFVYKGWALSIFTALLILLSRNYKLYGYLGSIPLFGFWVLDAYYLRQERLFRKLYDSIRIKNETDFSMSTADFGNSECWFKIAFSKSIVWLYPVMLIVITCIAIF